MFDFCTLTVVISQKLSTNVRHGNTNSITRFLKDNSLNRLGGRRRVETDINSINKLRNRLTRELIDQEIVRFVGSKNQPLGCLIYECINRVII